MRVLLVDHDSVALETITRAIRGVLELDCVTSKGDALLLLRQNTYEVLIACERCVDGSGLDLLGRTTRTAVPLKRIFAAAPERLQLLGPRLAPFKVQRTINYPIDLEELWLAIAQVTSGPNDETDGTIERVVLDERGIPATGTVPRGPIPPRPPSPLALVPPPPPPMPAPVVAANVNRTATARQAQPAPEPPLRAPPRRAPAAPPPPATTSDTGRMRAAIAPPRTTSDTGRMRAPPMVPASEPIITAAPPGLPEWTPEAPRDEDLADIAAQARLGVQQRTTDDATRRKRTRLFIAGGIALVVAGAIVFAIETFYDPEARAREAAIRSEVARMAEQQKVTDSLTLIEVDIENAIMNNDLETARRELAQLIEKSPDHPRREFLRASIERAEELARLAGQKDEKSGAKVAASTTPAPGASTATPTRAERSTSRTPERNQTARTSNNGSGSGGRAFGAPISEAPVREPTIPLNAPINTPPTYSAPRTDNSFPGRTVEASDSATGRSPATTTARTPPTVAGAAPAPAPAGAGSAEVALPSTAPAPPAPAIDVVPAKIIKRVTPVAPAGISRKTEGFVVVRFQIGTDGRVSDLTVVESQPRGVFDNAAQDAVRKWVYEPRRENGVAVESTARARLVFDAAN